jgi:hypothetical protein
MPKAGRTEIHALPRVAHQSAAGTVVDDPTSCFSLYGVRVHVHEHLRARLYMCACVYV